jgi:hypothetical protein
MRNRLVVTVVGLIVGLAIGLVSYTTPAYALGTAATDVTWNVQSSNGTDTGTALGNVRTFTAAGGQVLKAAAFSMDSTSSALDAAYLGQYSPGLGACNKGEFPSCADPNHTVDNSSRIDMVSSSSARTISTRCS